MTLKEVHHRILSFFAPLIKLDNYEEQVIQESPDDQPVRLLAIASSKYTPCEYCGKKGCEGCLVPYTD
jgi:hypothetical protein